MESLHSLHKATALCCMNVDNSKLWSLESMWININQQSLGKESGGGSPQIVHHVKPESEIC